MNVLADGSARKSVPILAALAALAAGGGCGGPRAARPAPVHGDSAAQYGRRGGGELRDDPGAGDRHRVRVLTIAARSGYASWLSCIGKGQVWLRSPAGSFTAACGYGSTWTAGQTQPTHLPAGQQVTVRVVAASGTRWELRIDGPPPAS